MWSMQGVIERRETKGGVIWGGRERDLNKWPLCSRNVWVWEGDVS